jgi:hypothetical protein
MFKKAGDFLQRFSHLAKSNDEVKEVVCLLLFEVGALVAEKKNITIKNTTLFLKISPVKKSEVFLKKQKILDALTKNPITKHITQIR